MKQSILTVALLVLSGVAAAQDVVTIPKTVPYAEGVASDAIRNECNWNTQISTTIAEFAKSGVAIAPADLDQAKGKVLSMTVIHVHAAGGGGFSGPKWATIKGELREGGNVVGSFYANRTTSTGGMTACAALERVGKAIAKDISIWLKAPTMEAKLGNAK